MISIDPVSFKKFDSQNVPYSLPCGHILGLPTIQSLLQKKCPICNRPFRDQDLRKIYLSMNEAPYYPDEEIIEAINQIVQLRKDVIQRLKKILNWNIGMLAADTLCTGAKVVATGLALVTKQYQALGLLISGASSAAGAITDVVQFAVEHLNEKSFRSLVSQHDRLSADPRVAEFLNRNAIEYNKAHKCSKVMVCVNALSLLISTTFCLIQSKEICVSSGMLNTNLQRDANYVTNEHVCFKLAINRSCPDREVFKKDNTAGGKCFSQQEVRIITCVTTLIQVGKCISKWIDYSRDKKKISDEISALEKSIDLIENLLKPNEETNSTEESEFNN